jgi:hypothetical protein
LMTSQALFGSIGIVDDSTDAGLYRTHPHKPIRGAYTVSLRFTLPKPARGARISFTLPANQSVTNVRGARIIERDDELIVLTITPSIGRATKSAKGWVEFDVQLDPGAEADKKVNSFQIAGL